MNGNIILGSENFLWCLDISEGDAVVCVDDGSDVWESDEKRFTNGKEYVIQKGLLICDDNGETWSHPRYEFFIKKAQ